MQLEYNLKMKDHPKPEEKGHDVILIILRMLVSLAFSGGFLTSFILFVRVIDVNSFSDLIKLGLFCWCWFFLYHNLIVSVDGDPVNGKNSPFSLSLLVLLIKSLFD